MPFSHMTFSRSFVVVAETDRSQQEGSKKSYQDCKREKPPADLNNLYIGPKSSFFLCRKTWCTTYLKGKYQRGA